ncbi:MAG: SDR family oxidoreductase [Acidobacteria bacterium]|nr:SDR family oxidoreductase [Acidobacteriota bacterium]
MSRVLVTGGAGYVGCILIPKLLDAGHDVTVYDLMLFGDDGLPEHERLRVVKGDIRDTETLTKELQGMDSVIHLACISNDTRFELDPDLGKSINYDCFEPMVRAAKEAGVKRFIYASTSSVYGVSDAPEVTEEHPLVPLTDYNRFKGMCEPQLLKYQSEDFTTVTIRPATVCGYSPRMRFDLTVNILTNHAVNKGKITVFGGKQLRPNIHVDDIAELYVELLDMPAEKIAGQTFNAGYQNHSVSELAEMVRKVVEEEMPERAPINVETTVSDDPRSYHVSSKKIAEKLGYQPKRSVEDAVRDLCRAFKAGKLPDSLEDLRATAHDDSSFEGAEYVFHFAGIGDIVPSIEHPIEYMSSNVMGTVYALEAARHAGVRKFVYAASSSCYGLAEELPTTENAPISPEYPYALSKFQGEEAVLHWGRVYHLPVVSIRIFNAYGPRSRTSGAYGAVFGVFLAQKLAGKPYTVVGDGTQTRDFVFVTDLARAFLGGAESDRTGEIYNVGAGNPQPVNRLVELLEGEVVYVPRRPGEPDCTWADISKIRRELGWDEQERLSPQD